MDRHPRITIRPCSTLASVGIFAATTAIVVALWNSPSLAFGGCVQASPENPSLILGLLGGAVAALPLLRARLRSRTRKSSRRSQER